MCPSQVPVHPKAQISVQSSSQEPEQLESQEPEQPLQPEEELLSSSQSSQLVNKDPKAITPKNGSAR